MQKTKSFCAFLLSIVIVLTFTVYLHTGPFDSKSKDQNTFTTDNKIINNVSEDNEGAIVDDDEGNSLEENNANGDAAIQEELAEKSEEIEGGLKIEIGKTTDTGNVDSNANDNKEEGQEIDKVLPEKERIADVDNGLTALKADTTKSEENGEIYVDVDAEILKNMQNVNNSSKNREMALDVMVEEILYGNENKNEMLNERSANLKVDAVQEIVEMEQNEKRYIENDEVEEKEK